MKRNSFFRSTLLLLLLVAALGMTVAGCDLVGLVGLGGGGGESGNQGPTVEIDKEALSTMITSGDKITIFIAFNDPDGDELGVNWELMNIESGANLSVALQIFEGFARFTAPVVKIATEFVITVEVDDARGEIASDSVVITVNPIDSSQAILILDKELVGITAGNTANVAVTALKKDGTADTIDVASSKEAVATVSLDESAIIIAALSKGKATLVVTSGSGLTETMIVAVFQEGEASLTLDKTAITLVAGEEAVIGVIALKGDGSSDSIEVQSLDPPIAAVSVTGSAIRIMGGSAGVTTVKVTSGSGKTAQIKATVTSVDDLKTLIVDPESLIIPVGGTEILNLSATKTDGSPDTIMATLSDSGMATITMSGTAGSTTLTVNGVASGTTTIIVESESKLTKVVSVTVLATGAATLSLDKQTSTVVVGGTDVIGVTALKGDLTEDTVAVEIDDGTVAAVQISPDFRTITVVGAAESSSSVTVTSGSGVVKTFSVNVVPIAPGKWGSAKWDDDVFAP